MADPHQALGRFFDGELPESEVDGFRTHLASCRRCQAELDELMQLDVLGMRHLQLQALQGPRVVPIKPARHRPWWGWATASVALAATVVLVVSAPWPRGPSKGLWQPSKDERLVAARSSYPGAAQYHPLQRTLGSSLELPALPVKELAKLEDEHLAIAAAYLVRGDPGLVANALKELKADKTPDGDSERAMAHLVRGDLERADYEEALHFSERALQAASNHGPALWNKALALQGLGLTLMAAKTFDQVAQLGEPGWATEARQRAERLRAEANHVREEWNKAKAAADDLVKAGSTLTGEALRAPISRRLFYDAVRTRATAAEVMALLPLADQFDQQSGGSSLHDYVRWAAGRNFKVRGPVVLEYRRLLDSNDQSVARALSGSSEDDIALGAMAMFGHALDAEELRKLEAHVKALNDPWFDVYLLQMQSQFVGVKDLQEARKLLERALQVADASRLQYRSLQMKVALITCLLSASDLGGARIEAAAAWRAAEAAGDWGMQRQIIQMLAQMGRMRLDHPVAKAHLGEAVERTREERNPKQELFDREQLALLELENLSFEAAREQLDAAIATGLPITSVGAGALADLARQRPSPLDRQVMDRYRTTVSRLPLDEQALAMTIIGRWTIEVNHEEGRALLKDVIQKVGTPADPDGNQSRARAFAYSALMMEAAKRGDFDEVLKLFAEEAGVPAFPATCALALNLDVERSVAIARGPSGELKGAYDGARKVALPETLDGFVPKELPDMLAACGEVKVVARPPLFGRLGALPNSLAWSYLLLSRGAGASSSGAPEQGPHVVVQSPARSGRALRLDLAVPPPIITSPPPPGVVVVEGRDATPNRILAELKTASEADLVMHSVVNPYSGEAFLLAAEGTGTEGDIITATQIRSSALAKRPTVMLSACHAAHSAPVLYEARSLPAAFLVAGARAVFAADEAVPDQEGPAFFAAVRARIHEGISPAVALRDVRQSWLLEGKVKDWVKSVFLFE